MNNLILNDGNEIPQLGYGTYKLTGHEGTEAVQNAINNGYKLIDTAAFYNNEEAVGRGIWESDVDRDQLFITTKLWREHLGYQSAKREFNKSLQRLNLEYIDLYLIHWPANAKNYNNWQKTNADTWKGMEELQAEGKIKSIGVSNFWPKHLEALFLTANVKPAVNQIEFHPGYWQKEVVEYCKSLQIALEAWSPFARGEVFSNPTLQQIAKHHQKSVAQICLRWVIQHDIIAIPKSSSIERMQENKAIFDFELSSDQMQQINKLPQMGYSGESPEAWPDKA